MDRMSFFDSISGINYPNMIVDFFDHFIALKRLVEDYGFINVEEATNSSISFNVQFKSPEYKNRALSIIQYSGPIVIYNRAISVNIQVVSDLEIKFILQ